MSGQSLVELQIEADEKLRSQINKRICESQQQVTELNERICKNKKYLKAKKLEPKPEDLELMQRIIEISNDPETIREADEFARKIRRMTPDELYRSFDI